MIGATWSSVNEGEMFVWRDENGEPRVGRKIGGRAVIENEDGSVHETPMHNDSMVLIKHRESRA